MTEIPVIGPPATLAIKPNPSPISLIPVEILVKIFRIVADTYDFDCINSVRWPNYRPRRHPILDVVRRVCVRWFHIAGSDSTLWTTLFLEPTLLVSDPGRVLAGQSLRAKREDKCTAYSGDTRPLSVIINPHLYCWSKDQPFVALSFVCFCAEMAVQINRCIQPQLSSRIGSLALRFTQRDLFKHFENTVLSAAGAAMLVNLHTLSIVIEGTGANRVSVNIHLNAMFAELNSLRHLHLVSHYGGFEVSDTLGLRLQTFKLERNEIQCSEVIAILKFMEFTQAICLEGLRPTYKAPRASELRRERMSRPCLEKLVLKGCHLQAKALECFSLPNLRVLEVENASLNLLYDRLVPLIERSGCTLTHLKVFHYQETRDCDRLPEILLDRHIRFIANVIVRYKFYRKAERRAELRRRGVVRDYFAGLDQDHMRRVVSPTFSHELRRSLDPRLKDNYILWGEYDS
ncbi:hypothetical protein JR316_0012107 [Psilocybe cubensis]|nr:hypothetical protein JR316_0012107 [Psilocybe cubensis]KAH9475008.1 hypothetical protein JR316_0012107 [Psilocybe cubensis]